MQSIRNTGTSISTLIRILLWMGTIQGAQLHYSSYLVSQDANSIHGASFPNLFYVAYIPSPILTAEAMKALNKCSK